MSAPVRYRAYGLTICSELHVPGAMKIGADRQDWVAPPDLEIVEGPAILSEPATQLGPYRHAPGRLLFERKGVARYLCEAGRRIVVERAPHASDFAVSGSLIATALPAALWMRGEIVLHAAAAVLPGHTRAIAVCGPSGSGKSTILNELVAGGASVVRDDTLCLRLRGPVAEVSGLPACYFLGDHASGPEQTRAVHALPETRQSQSAALAGIACLEMPRPAHAGSLRKLSGAAALEALLANRHRPSIPKLLGATACLLQSLAPIAEYVPLYAWSRREGVHALDVEERSLLIDPECAGRHSRQISLLM